MEKEALIRSLKAQKFPENILRAFKKVKRENFIPENLKKYTYEDRPLPIGGGQTISQPYTIAFMLMLLELKNKQKILEVGSGSGYVLALMNEIAKKSQIYGVELRKELAQKSKEVLKDKKNIQIIQGDGSKGLPKEAPFDKILVSAAAEKIPQKLVKQLKVGGIMVAPVKNSIIMIQKFATENKIKEFPGFSFVPLIETKS
jgi:protein-L-isoaspartate(D-aspartate) O-methyltransferase